MPKRSSEDAALYLALDELAKYIRHRPDCHSMLECSCGLSALLERPPLRGLVQRMPVDLELDDVLYATATHYNVTAVELVGRRQHQGIARPRRVGMYVSRLVIGASYPTIGRHFRRDHTTVIAACRRVAADLRARPELQGTIDFVTDRARRRASMRAVKDPQPQLQEPLAAAG